jgi:hypothetical protein
MAESSKAKARKAEAESSKVKGKKNLGAEDGVKARSAAGALYEICGSGFHDGKPNAKSGF